MVRFGIQELTIPRPFRSIWTRPELFRLRMHVVRLRIVKQTILTIMRHLWPFRDHPDHYATIPTIPRPFRSFRTRLSFIRLVQTRKRTMFSIEELIIPTISHHSRPFWRRFRYDSDDSDPDRWTYFGLAHSTRFGLELVNHSPKMGSFRTESLCIDRPGSDWGGGSAWNRKFIPTNPNQTEPSQCAILNEMGCG